MRDSLGRRRAATTRVARGDQLTHIANNHTIMLSHLDNDEDEADFLAFAATRFASTALLAPLENAKILQQVNYIPSDDYLASKGMLGDDSSSDARAGRDSTNTEGTEGLDDSDVGSWPDGWSRIASIIF